MDLENNIFKKCDLNIDSLIDYGFIKDNDMYLYSKNILNDTFKVVVEIKDNKLTGKVIELDFDEEYNNFRFENTGEFNTKIKEEYISILNDIKNNCYKNNYFQSNQANRITKLIYDRYQDNPVFPWKDDNGVFKNSNNDKWYGLIMSISKDKIDKGNELVNIINVKLDDNEILELLKKDGYYKAYHMNKSKWITIILDDTLSDDEVMECIIKSHKYTEVSDTWLIPANPKYYDVINCFNDTDTIIWKQSNNIKVNDIVFLYVGAPISAILYKCEVLKVDIPYEYKDNNLSMKKVMEIKLIKRYDYSEYTFDILNKYGVKAIRGPRSIPMDLLEKLNG